MVRGRRGGPIGELLGALGLQRLFDLEAEESCAGIGVSDPVLCKEECNLPWATRQTNNIHKEPPPTLPYPK